MRISTMTLGALLLAASATPAFAQDAPTAPPPEITVNATAAIVSDYRFRGISQTDKQFAFQGSITVTHASGFYVSAWGSSVTDYVVAGGNARQEIDLIAGYSKTINGIKLDGGVLYYFYPRDKTPGVHSDFFEPYVDISTTLGPVTAKATVNYAPKQKALALDQTGVGSSFNSRSRDNVYLAGDFTGAIPKTPFSLTAHLGHTFGTSWLASSFGKGKEQDGYTDWALGVTATYKVLTLGVSYVDTDAKFNNLVGAVESKSGVVASLTASF
ncbi:TorF family putative porin [Sphingomonas psychrolutea]|uniref:Uncharacterized protein n=1 Tax=Sphingomonas psychrolutea TaxID=1259676 RepID=A0ABQ1G2Q1_9SPHN|nr:TorF family putative porin [Sphingomonas psychrolutea]GGA35196.1 hypothetical protein GCM10011395_01950 [Sphingomonas psychrolutea]